MLNQKFGSQQKATFHDEGWRSLEADQEEANTMSELRFVVDDKKLNGHFEGKWKVNNGRAKLKKPLNPEWLEDHFDRQYLKLVEQLGQKKVDDPNKPGWWMLIPRAKRWLPVPIGFNSNPNAVLSEILCETVPIFHQQGKECTCLFSSLASAFHYMNYKRVGKHIVDNQTNFIGKDANTQWKGLCTLLQHKQNVHQELNFKWYNRARGSKRRKNTL